MLKTKQYLKIALFTALLAGADQTAKFIVQKFFKDYASFNQGVAFSIPIPNGVVLFLTPVFLAAICIFAKGYFNFKNAVSVISLSLILAGGIGNFIDRIFYSAVIDFIDVGFWPSFNLADSFLTIGAFLIIVFHAKILNRFS